MSRNGIAKWLNQLGSHQRSQMDRNLTEASAFGKLDRSHNGIRWHPLVDHLADVAAVFEALCACRAVRRSLEAAAGRALDERDIARLAALVFLHDLGKANAGFQAKRWLDAERPRGWLKAGHGAEAIALLEAAIGDCGEALGLLVRLPMAAMSDWGTDETMGGLLRASIAHHGRPICNAPDWTAGSLFTEVIVTGSLVREGEGNAEINLVLTQETDEGKIGYWSEKLLGGAFEMHSKVPPRATGVRNKLYIWNLGGHPIRINGLRVELARTVRNQ